MSVGYPKDKQNLDGTLGDICTQLNRNLRRSVQLVTELSSYTDNQLTTAGYTAGEVTAIRTLMTDLQQFYNIYTGAASLASAKDFRPSMRVVWGIIGDS